MIDDYNKAIVQARAGTGKDVEIEVNWNDDKDVIRISIGTEQAVINKDDLVNCMMIYGSERNIQDLVPVKLTRIKRVEKLLGFKWTASRNIKKGETVEITAPYIQEIPIEDEVYQGVLNRQKKNKL